MRLYRALLVLYPAAFRHEYGGPMELAFEEQLRHSNNRAKVWLQALFDALAIAPKEHAHMIGQDIRYAFRTMASSPQFAAAAILSLALAIGANTALYGLWDSAINAWLPVRDPGQLVMFTNPASQGVSIGIRDGERTLMTYAEFEQMRDHTTTLSMVMAVESDLSPRQTLIDSSMQELKMRMVSREYFDTFGIHPAIGRFFNGGDNAADGAVLSDTFWRTRFGASPDVLGKTVTIRKAVLRIVGVAPRGFFGETSGQEPALWIPLPAQPSVMPGRDWLHDTGFDKVMWLHVFGRLKPGVSIKQAEAEANALLHAQLEAFYGSGFSAAERAKFLDQRLTARPAANGASNARSNLVDPLRILFLSVGVILVIACANLASLLIARGAGRKSEIALRLSLGASRVRLVRQLLTESLVLAVSGGVAGLALAYVFHLALVRMVTESDSNFHLSFPFGGRLLLFNLAITSGAALLFGMLPAWTTTRSTAALRSHGQNSASAMGSGQGRRRWGSPLVVVQLALSLPLLAGAGLLSKTLVNLQQVNVGFAKENLFELRVDAATVPDGPQRAMLFDRVAEDIRRIPGVTAATYSGHGVFAGGDSGDDIEVEGYTRTGETDAASRWSQVGPDYFTTMRIPLLRGRPFTAADSARAPRVCVINEAFQERFFANRNPMGLHLTNVDGPERTTCEVIGIARNSRTNAIRQPITPRYYVPVAQPLSKMEVSLYLFRSARAAGPMFAVVERAIRNVNPELSVYDARPVADRVDDRLAEDRITAQLATLFGIVALILAAAGLYGVLAHGVARRKGEIAIRMAIGARPAQVVGMFLRETATMIVLGLAAGAGLAYWTLTLLANQLYGLAPHDPATFALSALVLVAVALGASLVPARRAARLDPMAALRQE